MSEQDRKNFDDRLAELNNWQIEQQKKLKAFQEAQRKLLDLEHQNVLNGFNTHNFGQRHDRCSENISNNVSEKEETESNLNFQNLRNRDRDGIFHLKFPQIRLSEPKSSLFSAANYSPSVDKSDNFFSESVENSEERVAKPRKFLKRGEGLARFRMTLDDFKGPPKIYREKRIKTYLNGKPESKASSRSVKSARSSIKLKPSAPKAPAKSAALPVKIYTSESRNKGCNTGRSSEGKQAQPNSKKLSQFCPKSPVESLTLKPHVIATEWYNAMKAKEKAESRSEKQDDNGIAVGESDVENKKDEKELRIFEILEKKVDDVSFCSTSSFVDKLMEQSLSSTPSKGFVKSKENYAEGLKSLRRQFLDEGEVKRLGGVEEIPLETEEVSDGGEWEKEGAGRCSPGKVMMNEEEGSVRGSSAVGEEQKAEGVGLRGAEEREERPPQKVNKTLLQEYIKDFKKFKFMLAENAERMEEEEKEELSPKELLQEKPVGVSQQEIALKLQRKGLQDNVKQLLNWECPSRKRQPKRVVKKVKTRGKLEKSKAVSKEQSEKIVFNSSLLHERLNELEKEIEIFRKENKNLERLQKECSEERMRLSRERKELERRVQEEREQLEGKVAEEQRKLQKEKAVFEKYCKQVKNQPSRQEREEVAKLKKEVEKLTETLTTKEGRWGAAQARLRNQIKMVEKENSQLKAEVEKYKKLSSKKVSFENERNLNTKIIHVINAELGKLKPAVIRNAEGGRNQSLSARVEREVGEKPIRRIRSAPNVKKQTEGDVGGEAYSEMEEKAVGSVSTDSGIETNGSRYVAVQRAVQESKAGKEGAGGEGERGCGSPLCGVFGGEGAAGRKAESLVESGVREAIFGGGEMDATSLKIAEVKSRLERLSLLGRLEEGSEKCPVKMVRIPRSESEGSGSTGEEEEEEEEEESVERDVEECSLRKASEFSGTLSKPLLNSYPRGLVESKAGENGIWEKFYEDGSKEINYPNGNVKKIFPGSKIVRMTYYNGDIKETDVAEGSEKYYYAETKTWHTTYKDGLEVLEFPNGQTERRHADGSTEISFPNGCVRYCDSSGKDEWRFLDGTVIKTNQCGHKILLMPNGQKEIHTKEFKRREYPDGTVKILYSDGTQETRYASGRVRLKDKDGNLVMDSGGIR